MKMGLFSRFLSGYTIVIGSHIRKQLEFLKENTPISFKHRQMDDLGCGDGKLTLLLKDILLPTRLRGFDINPRLVRRARNKGIEANVKNLEEDMPRGELAVLWGVLHHLKDKEDCLKRVKENYDLIFIREPIRNSIFRVLELGNTLRKEEFEHLVKKHLAGSQIYYCGNNILIFYMSPKSNWPRKRSHDREN